MPFEQSALEQLEAYRRGDMPPPERAAFERQQCSDPATAAETAIYERLLDGLAGLQSASFSELLPGWALAAAEEDADDEELIEWYLAGELGSEWAAKVAQRRAEDPVFAQRLADSEVLRDGFQGLQGQHLAQQMQAWAAQLPADSGTTATVKPLPPAAGGRMWRLVRLAAAASVVLVFTFAMRWHASTKYSDAALTQAFYQEPNLGNLLGGETQTILPSADLFKQAHEAFLEGRYEAAAEDFDRLLEQLPNSDLDALTQQYYRDNASWTRLLARLAAGQSGPDLQAALRVIAQDPQHEHSAKAQKLHDQLGSFWRKMR